MSVQISLTNGDKVIVQGDFDATVNAMSERRHVFTTDAGRRIYIPSNHIVSLLEEGKSVDEDRGVVSTGE